MNTSCDYSDTKFRVQSNIVRYGWAAYQLFVLLSSFIGDSLILVASFQNSAFKINKLIVTVIQHIAVSDLAYSLVQVFPGAVSLITNQWVFGNIVCYLSAYITYFPYTAGMLFIANLTALKFLILKYPLRATTWKTKRVHQVCCSIWALCLAWPVLMFAVERDDVKFEYRSYRCHYEFRAESWKIIHPILSVIFSFLPNLVIILTTIPTLKYLAAARKSARRARGSLPRQGIITVVLTALAFTISTLPYVIYRVVVKFIKHDCSGWLNLEFYRIVASFLFVNTMANFYIYALTIRSFRRFLLSKILPDFISRDRGSTITGM